MQLPGQILQAVSQLPDPQLIEIAKNPPPQTPGLQYAAISELGQRAKQRLSPQQPAPSSVMDDLHAQSGTSPSGFNSPQGVSAPAGPGEPVASGAANITASQPATMGNVQQMLAQQKPQGMAKGGAVDDYTQYANAFLPLLTQGLQNQTPEDAMKTEALFQGPDMLSPWAGKIASEQGDLDKDRSFGRWMALAQAGAGIASAHNGNFLSNIAAGLNPGLSALTTSEAAYKTGKKDMTARELALDMARQKRGDDQGKEASGFYAQGIDALSKAREGALKESGDLYKVKAQERMSDKDNSAAYARAMLGDDLEQTTKKLIQASIDPKTGKPTKSYAVALKEAMDYKSKLSGRGGAIDKTSIMGLTQSQLLTNIRTYSEQVALNPELQPILDSLIEERDRRIRGGTATDTKTAVEKATVPAQGRGGNPTAAAAAAAVNEDSLARLRAKLAGSNPSYTGTDADGIQNFTTKPGR